MSSECVQIQQSTLKELLSVVNSISRGDKHLVRVEGEESPCFWQRQEWVEWAQEVAQIAEAELKNCLEKMDAPAGGSNYANETLEQRLSRLRKIMTQVSDCPDGIMLAQRIEGDLYRLMNTAWLNCSDVLNRQEQIMTGAVPEATTAAMNYAATAPDGQEFLKQWLAQDFEVIRRRWPDAPEIIYVILGSG